MTGHFAGLRRAGVVFGVTAGWRLAEGHADPSIRARYDSRVSGAPSFDAYSAALHKWARDECERRSRPAGD